MLLALLLSALAAVPQAPATGSSTLPGSRQGVLDLVQVRLSDARERELLRRFASDIDDHFHAPERARIFADDREQALLARLGLELEVVQEDLVGFYAERLEGQENLSAGGSFAGYRTYPEMKLDMIQLAASYPHIISHPLNLGTTVEGRPIWALRVSDSPNVHEAQEPTVWYDGLHHAREPISGEAVLRFAEYIAANYSSDAELRALVDARNLILIPCVNPDGYEFNYLLTPSGGGMWRKNKAANSDGSTGVDLNRNYSWEWGAQWPGSSGMPGNQDYRGPSPFSEPETSALRDAALFWPPDISISCHSFGGACVLPWGYDALFTPDDAIMRGYAADIAVPLGWEYGTVWESLGFANGTSSDFQYGTHGTLALALEIGDDADGFWPVGARIDELCDDVRPAFLHAARVAGPAPRVADARLGEVAGDGDPWPEAGEVWGVALTLVNDGMLPSDGRLWLGAPSAWVGASTAPHDYQLAAHAELQHTFAFDILLEAAEGDQFEVVLHLESVELEQEISLPIAIGEGHCLARETCELGDLGWAVEGSATGAWECADPELVIDVQSGESTQPGVDGGGDPNGSAWTTGPLAGATATAHDVDGSTSLTSPRFAAAAYGHLELRFRRWFVSLPESGQGDDRLRLEVSNDDGASWVPVEELLHEGIWSLARYDLESFVPLTDEMRLRFHVSDQPDDDLTEALVDELELWTVSQLPTLGLWGATLAGKSPRLFAHAPKRAGASFRVLRALAAGGGVAVPGAEGLYHLQGPVQTLGAGTLDANGKAQLDLPLASHLFPIGGRLYLQLVVDEGGPQAAYSKLLEVRIE